MAAYFDALAKFEEAGNKAGIASSYNDIAILHYLQGSYEQCMEYLTLSFEIKEELGDREGMSNAELIEFKADRMPLGYYHGKDRAFTHHDIKLEIGDTFYIFSDGFIDQKNKLEQALRQWMGDQPQIDDILVVGVRV